MTILLKGLKICNYGTSFANIFSVHNYSLEDLLMAQKCPLVSLPKNTANDVKNTNKAMKQVDIMDWPARSTDLNY